LNAHYLHLFQDAEIPVHSCAYRNPMANPSTMASVFNNDHGDFLEMLPHHRREMIWNLISHLCILRPDRLHCFVDLSCLIGGISTILTKIPYVLFSFRNKNPTHFSFGHPWFFPYYRQLIESKRVILTGNSSAGNSDYANWLEISQGSIAIVRNGINQKEWKKISPNERDAARRHFNIGKNHACIAGVFQLEHYKTPLSFLKVIDRLVNRIQQPLKVLVAGNGQLSTVFRNAIRDYKLEDVVQMLGHRKDVPRILAAADLLLLSSGYGEGTPNVLLEAQARGLPVVTSDAGGGASEALDDGKSGF
jgi:glycosyltransferase involved in cell wall biosynthesis